jgi:hypothetical protein
VAAPPASAPAGGPARTLLVQNATGRGRTAGKTKLAFAGTSMVQLHDAVAELLQLHAHALRREVWDGEFEEWVTVLALGDVPAKSKVQVQLAA